LFLAKYNSAESKAQYVRIVALIAGNNDCFQHGAGDITVNEALAMFTKHIESHCVDEVGKPACIIENFKLALGDRRRVFGSI
jgi:hypothetical protein